MKKLFVAVTVACLGLILASITARAGGLAFDASGNLFAVDGSQHSIFKFTPDGTRSTFATGFKNADNLSFDSKGDLFASDFGQKSIFKFTPDGEKSTFATAIKVLGMVIDRSDNVYVSDGDSIFKFTPDGEKSTFATGINAFGMAIDGSDNLYFSSGHSIFKLTPDGKKSTFATVRWANGMAIDGAGNLFVADRDNWSILKLAPDATQSTFATVLEPWGVAVDRTGNLFVSTSHSIFKFAPDGNRSRFAGLDISPDNKWEYFQEPDDPTGTKIVKAGTNEVALDLSDECGRGSVDWSPDSKRFALNCHERGRWNGGASLYQLSGDKWKALKSPYDDVQEILDKAIAAQVKKRGLPKKTDLRLIWQRLEVRRWVDSNTAIVYGGLEEAVRQNLDEAFGAHFLVTLKFDAEGNWKIVKSHEMSEKEIEKEP
jgi:sugar lactone lactonase YvrE